MRLEHCQTDRNVGGNPTGDSKLYGGVEEWAVSLRLDRSAERRVGSNPIIPTN